MSQRVASPLFLHLAQGGLQGLSPPLCPKYVPHEAAPQVVLKAPIAMGQNEPVGKLYEADRLVPRRALPVGEQVSAAKCHPVLRPFLLQAIGHPVDKCPSHAPPAQVPARAQDVDQRPGLVPIHQKGRYNVTLPMYHK